MDKIKLTIKQIHTIESVFNYALNYLDDMFDNNFIARLDENNTVKEIRKEDEIKRIKELFHYIEDNSEVVENKEKK